MLIRRSAHPILFLLSIADNFFDCLARPSRGTEEFSESSNGLLEDSVHLNEISEHELKRKPAHSDAGASWPTGEYCIMPGRTLSCPEGFQLDSVSLAVPVNFGPKERYNGGEEDVPYIRLGRVGGFNLGIREYDQAYTLQMSACCRTW